MSKQKKKSKPAAVVCRIIGFVLILFIVFCCIPVVLPKLFGFQEYSIVSGSMEPTIKTGSLIYVSSVDNPADIDPGEIIAFTSPDDGTVICHRVIDNNAIEGVYVTKGDNNRENDPVNPSYSNLIGEVRYYTPYLGVIAGILGTIVGKIYAGMILLCGFLLVILSSIISKKG